MPANIRSLQVKAIGERGGYGKREDSTLIAGGFGGEVSGTVFVKPKRSYWIEVDVGGGKGGPGALPGGEAAARPRSACAGAPIRSATASAARSSRA